MIWGKRKPSLMQKQSPIVLTKGLLTITDQVKQFSTKDFDKLSSEYVQKIGDSILPLRSFKGFAEQRIKENAFVAILLYKDIPSGFIVGHCAQSPLYEGHLITMEVFNTNLTGILAAHSVVLAHRALAMKGKQLNADYASTTCYYKDVYHTLNKILARDGWTSQGYMSVLKLKD